MAVINILDINQNLHVESVASEYIRFPNQAVKTFAGKTV